MDTKGSPFWYIVPYGERYRTALETEPLRDVWSEMDGRPIGGTWIPPAYEIVRKGLWPDWMFFRVPQLSERAMKVLGELLQPHCEFLPWVDEPGHRYTLLNVLTKIPRQDWTCKTSSVYDDTYAAADGISIKASLVPHVFCLEGYRGKIFVSDTVAQRSVEHGLKGVAFVHPSISELSLIHISFRFGRSGTGFARRGDALPDVSERATH